MGKTNIISKSVGDLVECIVDTLTPMHSNIIDKPVELNHYYIVAQVVHNPETGEYLVGFDESLTKNKKHRALYAPERFRLVQSADKGKDILESIWT